MTDNEKDWVALSCPTAGLRFDAHTLELLDLDHDGHIRTPEVRAALAFLARKNVSLESLKTFEESDSVRLAEVRDQLAKLESSPLSEAEQAELAAWQAKEKEVSPLGEQTAAAEAKLAAVESIVDGYFTPPADMPLVTDEPEKILPLSQRLNPQHEDAIRAFAASCVAPILGAEKTELTRSEWLQVKAKFADYRAWRAAKPVRQLAGAPALKEEERLLTYKQHLGEFLENFITMDRLYATNDAIFQAGILRIDGRELSLCFEVANEASHAGLVANSNCCVIYLALTRPNATRHICAVVTRGKVGPLYVGRNGVFYDRDGQDWDAVVSKVVENQVSLAEAFWAPWRKIGTGIAGAAKKFLGDRQTRAVDTVQKGTVSAQAGGVAMASSVAAVGIGVGMVGAAAASVITAIKGLHPWWMFLVALAAIVLIVSIPSVILAYFKLRKRDLGAILNACGWAINRPMRVKKL